ncbi:MAG TPA: tRNA preQ1(34) S-adenosylmethionine ribosyltransferase-isomerase QueA [Casimicrobiaceae bacterium]|jgi:S-adenosylmethionine:tRNA ribosyltransferase-isomerase
MTSNGRYRLSDFDFELPVDLIAQFPAPQRSSSRLLHVAGARREDLAFGALPGLLAPGDLLVFNDTRVVRSRILGRKPSGGRIELMLERLVGAREAWMQARASHLPRVGSRVDLPAGGVATVCERDQRFFRLRFDVPTPTLAEYLEEYGAVPLPPYIRRTPDAADLERYQTVYARHPGAVAAPTAGLHFDEPVLAALRARGVNFAYVTLHVGAGTFLPVESEDLAHHRMHSERFTIPPATLAAIDATRGKGAIVAIGTTSLRALETVAQAAPNGDEMETSLFITPGFRFRVVDRLLTNFHLPRSTLLMLVSAFAGYDTIRAAYAHAIAARYRFFSYGDAMLLERAADAG